MTTVEHTHTEFTTKDEMSDFRVVVTNMMTQLSQANLAANHRMDRFEARMDRLEDQMRQARIELQQNNRSIQALTEANRQMTEANRQMTEANRRVIGFRTSEDE